MRTSGQIHDVSLRCVISGDPLQGHQRDRPHVISLTPTTTTAPLAYPIAILLDLVLGIDKHHTYKKAELKSFLQFHRNGEEPLRDEEISILNGVLELNTKNVETIMTPLRVIEVPTLYDG